MPANCGCPAAPNRARPGRSNRGTSAGSGTGSGTGSGSAPAGVRGFRAEFREGLAAFLGNRVLVAICVATSVAMVGVGALNALDVFFVSDNLHADPKWLGLLGAAFGLGSIVGALANGFLVRRLGSRRVFWLGLVAGGCLMLGYSRTSDLPWALAVLFLAGLPISALNSVGGPIVMEVTPREALGRVAAVLNPVTRLASVLAVAVSGVLSSTVLLRFHTTVLGVRFGRIDVIFGVAALLMVAAGRVAFRLWNPGAGRAGPIWSRGRRGRRGAAEAAGAGAGE